MAEEEKAEQQDKKPEKGSKKLLIIGLFAGLLLGGGGGFGAFTMMGGGENHENHETRVEEPVVEEPEVELHFVKVEHVTIPLVYNHRILGNMMMDFSLEVDGNENKMAVIQGLPEIRDAILRHYSDTPLGKKDSLQTVDYPRLKKTIKDISAKILHEPLVREVLIVQVRRF